MPSRTRLARAVTYPLSVWYSFTNSKSMWPWFMLRPALIFFWYFATLMLE